MLTLNRFHTFVWYFHGWLWTSKYQLGSLIVRLMHFMIVCVEWIITHLLDFIWSGNVKRIFKCETQLIFIQKGSFIKTAEVYWKSSQASKMELFVKILNGFQSLTMFSKSSVLDVCQCSECATELCSIFTTYRK